MKKLYYILLFFAGISFAQPVIQNPGPLAICDDNNNDGIATFDLTPVDGYVLGALDPAMHTVTYYETQSGAETGNVEDQIGPFYTNVGGTPQTIHIRVVENSNPSLYSLTTIQLKVEMLPLPPVVDDMIFYENPSDDIGIFNLTTQDAVIMNGLSNLDVTYFTSLFDAQAQVNPIANESTFSNSSNPQTIFANVQSTVTGCFAITSFNLIVSADGIIIIPDPALKNALLTAGGEFNTFITGADNLPVVVDQNSDGEIQFTEAGLVYALEVNELGISTMQGVEYFTNLRRLSFWDNDVSSVNLSTLINLEHLNISSNNFSTLNVDALAALTELHVSSNMMSTLDVTNCPLLEILQCEENGMTSLNISGLTNLTNLSCYSNQISVLDITAATALETLFCGDNQLTTLDLNNAGNLTLLNCISNNITALNLSTVPLLNVLWVDNNPITNLNISNLQDLSNFSATNVLLTTLDASSNPALCNYFAVSGPVLEYVNVKNGTSCAYTYHLLDNPSLQFVCADDDDVEELLTYFDANAMTVNVNSYCTFSPGGDYNTITGIVSFDANNNGADASDPVFPLIKMEIQGLDGIGAAFTDTAGSYTFYTQEGDYSIMPVFENQNFFDLFLPFGINFPTVDNSVVTQNFTIVANGVHPDVEVAIVPLVPSQPGFDATYKIVYKNKGNQLLSGHVFFEFENVYMELVSAIPSPDILLLGYLGFEYENLMPFENREIIVTLNVNAPTDTPPVNIDDVFHFTANAIIDQGTDETPGDNIFEYSETVIGSYDPNNKLCSEGEVISTNEIGEYLHYVINFENTGTAPAQNIVVRDILNPLHFEIASMQIMNSSHPVVARQTGNILECIFEGINLDSGGHGNILLKIKSLSTLTNGDEVANKADIFFDYNFPIETNDAVTSFELLKVGEAQGTLLLTFSPNPVTEILTLKSEEVIEKLELFDLQGRLLQSTSADSVQVQIDMSGRQAGVYILKAISGSNHSILKFIKN